MLLVKWVSSNLKRQEMRSSTLENLVWNPKMEVLEDDLPFQLGDFSVLFIRSSHSLPESKDPGNS